MLDAADVLINGEPVVGSRVQHGSILILASKTGEVPGRLHKGVESVCLAPCCGAAGRAVRLVKFSHFAER